MNTVENAPCFVLHSKPFKDTSAIVELLSQDYGRVSVIYKGVRSSKNTAKSRVLQPFQPLLASWYGKRELKSGKQVEQAGASNLLVGKRLYSGIYLNEILMRLLHRDAPAEGIFEHYQQCLAELQVADTIELPLRQFEWRLLEAIGYQLPCEYDARNDAPIVDGAYYRYEVNNGFIYEHSFDQNVDQNFDRNVGQKRSLPRPSVFSGELLLAISRDKLEINMLPEAKRLMRMALAPHLGDKPLESKKLFMGMSK